MNKTEVKEYLKGKLRADTWVNALTGLGSALRDKTQSTEFQGAGRLADQTLENLFHEEDMAGRICEARPGEALRQGVSFSASNDDDEKMSQFLTDEMERLQILEKFEDADVWSNVFGGAVIYMGIDDGLPEERPVNWNRVKDIKFASVLDKRSLYPLFYYGDPEGDKFGLPEVFQVDTMPSGITRPGAKIKPLSKIHESRLVIFHGARTTLRRRQQNGGWPDSILVKVHQVLMQFNIGWQGTSHLLQDASQGVFKLTGLIDMIAENNQELLQARMEVVDMGRSVARAIMLDADNEDFRREQFSFQGLPDVLQAFMLRLSAAADMPVTVLMGQSPSGLNATGESDTRFWYDSIKKYQNGSVTPRMKQIAQMLLSQQSYSGPEPENLKVVYPPLWQETRKEKADTDKTIAETDKIYAVDIGSALPEEVALTRHRKGGGADSDLIIDEDSRKDMLQAELKAAKETAGQPDPVEPVNAPPPAEEG